MTHAEIDALVKEFVIERAGRDGKKPNPRVQQAVLRILGDLFKTIEELDLSASEVWSGLDYLQELGKNGEVGLLAAGLGLEHFLDLRMDEADAREGLSGGTPRSIEGPMYVLGAPERFAFDRLDDGQDLNKAPVLFMSGTVLGLNGNELPGAKVEVWHANAEGRYSYFDESQTPFNLRRTLITDNNGQYAFRSILPKGYNCPPDGPTRKLLDQLGRHGHSPAHIHFMVSAPGYHKLTTQIALAGDRYLGDDFAFADRVGLVPEVRWADDPQALAGVLGFNDGLPGGEFAVINFDFILKPARRGEADTSVHRHRAESHEEPAGFFGVSGRPWIGRAPY